MQENLIELLRSKDYEINKIELKQMEQGDKVIFRIIDSDRLIFLIELDDIKKIDLELYVNKLMDWITYQQKSEDNDLVEKYQNITMRKILWDMYVIFVTCLSEINEGITDEEIYRIQRDSRFMKRYIVQGKSEDEVVKKIGFIVRPEEEIDNFIDKLDFDINEEEHCRKMCHTKEGIEFGFGFVGISYKEIISLLKKINEETFGEDENENT
jgi:hypothetical protein